MHPLVGPLVGPQELQPLGLGLRLLPGRLVVRAVVVPEPELAQALVRLAAVSA
jgi:hypothetical protein